MTPDQIRTTRKALGLTQAEFAILIRSSRSAIVRSEADEAVVPAWLAMICRLINALGPERALEVLRAEGKDSVVPTD